MNRFMIGDKVTHPNFKGSGTIVDIWPWTGNPNSFWRNIYPNGLMVVNWPSSIRAKFYDSKDPKISLAKPESNPEWADLWEMSAV